MQGIRKLACIEAIYFMILLFLLIDFLLKITNQTSYFRLKPFRVLVASVLSVNVRAYYECTNMKKCTT